MTTDELLHKLLKPTYVYRMAFGMIHAPDGQGKSARTRMDNARKEIEEILDQYTTEKFGRCKRCGRLLDKGVCWFHTP